MIKTRGILSTFALAICAGLYAQELRLDELPALRERAMVIQITTTVEGSNHESWNAFSSKVTIPGRPVGIKLVGDNIVIAVQFTPYLRQGKFALVAQSQIWINIPEKGMSYKTDTHSIPVDLGEPILYLPLGADTSPDNPHIELVLTMYRYGEEPVTEEGTEQASGTSGEAVPPPRRGAEPGTQADPPRPGGRPR